MTPQRPVAAIGEITSNTLNPADLIETYFQSLDSLMLGSEYFAAPENHAERDALCDLIGEGMDAYTDNGEGIREEVDEMELLESLADELETFAPPYSYFGSHEGDGACIGFWPCVESAMEDLPVLSCNGFQTRFVVHDPKEVLDEMPEDFRGEYCFVNDHGNVSFLVREDDGSDTEIWTVI